MKFGTLAKALVGSLVVLSSFNSDQHWKVIDVRDLRQTPLHPVSYRLRPEVVRGQYSVKLQNVKTGRIRTVYRAENVACRPVA